ncbi:hypothetical protein U0035_13270 [Niabella yanshanensis]|uniref:Uncharacterized protein n=1 Tax=Niabella yanshanensis TaxID=577386 RepID=A0ABZ0W038_9BACT|nr:hypothetical protein [Niabella yanshanensis]WQD36638.1 hypothetical protein U0035_13270 [Niabella yanshanensis]
MDEKKGLSFLEKLKAKARAQEKYGGELKTQAANMGANTCPNCGAGRAKEDGVTHCAYCGHAFMQVKLTDGLNIKKEDNSRENL